MMHTMQTSCSVLPQRCHSSHQLCFCNIPPGEESLADTLPVLPMTADSLRKHTDGKLMPAFKGCCQSQIITHAARQHCLSMCKYLQNPYIHTHLHILACIHSDERETESSLHDSSKPGVVLWGTMWAYAHDSCTNSFDLQWLGCLIAMLYNNIN